MSTLYPREIFMSEHALIDAFKRKERQWKRSFETSTSWQNTVRDEQIRDRIVTGILDKSLSQNLQVKSDLTNDTTLQMTVSRSW